VVYDCHVRNFPTPALVVLTTLSTLRFAFGAPQKHDIATSLKNEKQIKSPKEETEELLNAIMPFAKQMLEKQGEFYPVGAATLSNGKIVMVSARENDHHPSPQILIDDLLATFRIAAKSGKYKATAIVANILARPPGEAKKINAISVYLDHMSGYSVQVVFPYRITPKNEVILSKPFASSGHRNVFPE
jgi:hypothetical protein